jgi:hypothetical protein
VFGSFNRPGVERQRGKEPVENAAITGRHVRGGAARPASYEISNALNALAKEGLIPTIDELAALSPYQTKHIKRFGNYELDLSAVPAPIADDLTFAIEPPKEPDVVEADQEALP